MCSACQKADHQKLKNELLTLHKTGIDAHWEKDIDFFVRDIDEHYFSVNNGEIRYPSKEEITRQFNNYLNNTTFYKYEDMQDPIVVIADDGSLAYTLVRVKISGERKLEADSIREFGFVCAWITLYKREGEKWIRMGEVSNFGEL
jgi:hypothetical protein